jgi:two-component system sensor histidine kinase KdpD
MLTGRKVEVRLPDTLPRIWVDFELITKVLWHLLENAAKYSPAAEPIFISGVREGNQLAVSVADHGAGIDPLEQEMIFDKFYRGQNQRYSIHGTGMGLAIAKAIMEAHGGSIHVTSQVGHGSVFTICLPLAL